VKHFIVFKIINGFFRKEKPFEFCIIIKLSKQKLKLKLFESFHKKHFALQLTANIVRQAFVGTSVVYAR
jgi:hypothetical protein